MSQHYFFAGGGTGGHLYPAIAVATKLKQSSPDCKITFFCSQRPIDRRILSNAKFDFMPLPAEGFSLKPSKLINFFKAAQKSRKMAEAELKSAKMPKIISCGGFVSFPVVLSANKLHLPIYMLNVDIIPGKANKFLARYASKIFVQFDDTIAKFKSGEKKAVAFGCPLRAEFSNPDRQKAIKELGIDCNKKVLLITGASTGATNINNAMIEMLEKLNTFAGSWQIVHLTGIGNLQAIKEAYKSAKIHTIAVDYYEDMANLMVASDLLIGRSGAVSVAEYAACRIPSICMPYPYHKDNHQRLNAQKIVDAGCGIIVDDKCDAKLNAQALWPVLEEVMKNNEKRTAMKIAAMKTAKSDAAQKIADTICKM